MAMKEQQRTVYKTARGKPIDMNKLATHNEMTSAVGNAKVNARGDQLGPGGRIEQGRNQTMDKYYKMHTPSVNNNPELVADKQRQAGASVGQGRPVAAVQPVTDSDGVPFDPPMGDIIEPPPVPLRGSFADSIAREVTVTQDLLTPPNQPKGPTRI
jgi:hypothetical protein